MPADRRAPRSGLTLGAVLRMAFVALLLSMQLLLLVASVRLLRQHAVALYTLLELGCSVAIVALVSEHEDAAYRYAWVVCVLLLGVFGLVLYLLWGRGTRRNRLSRRIREVFGRRREALAPPPGVAERLEAGFPDAQRLSGYLAREGFPAYDATGARYFPLGEQMFDALCEDLERAQRFIYLEFFMVFEGQVYERLLDILARKAAQGLDVRLIYDDLGSIVTTSRPFLERLERAGVRVVIFNPVHRYVHQLYLNYRDHRKIASIDGQVCYTGGVNIGDEYANLYPKHGHWKDTAVRLEGAGAYSLTVFFLQMWQACTGEEPDFAACRPSPCAAGEGYVQPYEDGPYNNPNNTAENVYRQLIGGARRSVYITTPYLVLDETLFSDLCMAARSGVDVRIVIPGIPDHWYVQQVSLSFAGPLLQSGVRIYRYTPGFIHAKLCVADGQRATVGTVNLDYRSFYLHYEDGVLFTGGPVPGAVEADILQTLSRCEELRYDAWRRRPALQKAVQPLLRIFAPMM